LNNLVTFKETVEVFAHTTIHQIISEEEVPKINFVFDKNAFLLFEEVMNNPFVKKGSWTPDINIYDIEVLKVMEKESLKEDAPIIFVKDSFLFFFLLKEIANAQVNLYAKYGEKRSPREVLLLLLRRIWLRMNVDDFNNVESFLMRQLKFLQNNLFDDFKFSREIGYFQDLNITAKSRVNRTWDEATRAMELTLSNGDVLHELPLIYYDICDDTCYIYAVQKDPFNKENATVKKRIYKIYRGDSQPSKVLALKLFIGLLKEKNISKICVPTLQVLSFSYHELLSEKEKDRFNKRWTKEQLENMRMLTGSELYRQLDIYQREKMWYRHIVDKEETISRLKTEDLIKLIYRITKEDENLELLSDIFVSDALLVKVKK